MKKDELKPVDLGHLEEKAEAVVSAFDKYHDMDRSLEYREFHLRKAEEIARTLSRDFRYYFDKYKIGGIVPYGLDEIKLEADLKHSE